MGGPQCHMSILRNGNVHVSVAYFPQCHMSNLRNEYVPCHYIFSPYVACHQALCHMSNLRNAIVTLSILGVKGHTQHFSQAGYPLHRENRENG